MTMVFHGVVLLIARSELEGCLVGVHWLVDVEGAETESLEAHMYEQEAEHYGSK